MTPTQMIQHLKDIGLTQVQRASVMDTYREEGESEAMLHAKRILKTDVELVRDAEKAANSMFGFSL